METSKPEKDTVPLLCWAVTLAVLQHHHCCFPISSNIEGKKTHKSGATRMCAWGAFARRSDSAWETDRKKREARENGVFVRKRRDVCICECGCVCARAR